MAVKDIKKFLDELMSDDGLREELAGLRLSPRDLDGLISFANVSGFSFTVDELIDVNSKEVEGELSLEELEKVSGGRNVFCGLCYKYTKCQGNCPFFQL